MSKMKSKARKALENVIIANILLFIIIILFMFWSWNLPLRELLLVLTFFGLLGGLINITIWCISMRTYIFAYQSADLWDTKQKGLENLERLAKMLDPLCKDENFERVFPLVIKKLIHRMNTLEKNVEKGFITEEEAINGLFDWK